MYRDGPNIYSTCGMACALILRAARDLSNTNKSRTSDLPYMSSTPNIKHWSSPRRTTESNRTYAEKSMEMCVVSNWPKILSIFVTISRSAIVHPCIGMVQTSILLVEWNVLQFCELSAIYPIPISLAFQTHQIGLQCLIKIVSLPVCHLSRLGLTPIRR